MWLTTATPDGKELFALAVDKDTGKILLDLKLFDVATPQFAHSFNSYASPTPVIEPGRVYVTFGSPGTAAIDTATGKVVWERRDLECNHFRGAGSSPIIFRNLLLMHFDGSDVQYVVALDKRTGKTVWKTDRSVDFQDLEPDGKIKADGDFRKAFSTPQIVMVGQRAGPRQPRIEGHLRLRSADGQGALADRGADQFLVQHPPGGRARPRLLHDRLEHGADPRRQA